MDRTGRGDDDDDGFACGGFGLGEVSMMTDDASFSLRCHANDAESGTDFETIRQDSVGVKVTEMNIQNPTKK